MLSSIHKRKFNIAGSHSVDWGIVNPIDINTMTDTEQLATCDDLLDLGISWVRTDFTWAAIETSQGVYSWDEYDRFVTNVTSKGLKILAIIDYGVQWASGNSDVHYPPTDVNDFANFAATVAQRYASFGVNHFEIWNEPNTSLFWKSSPDASAYTTLLKAAYSAIKSVSPLSTVLLGGLALESTTEDTAFKISPNIFLQRIYDNGGKDYFDVMNYHPYGWNETTISTLRNIMIDNGDEDKEIWFTEYGNPTNGTAGQQFVSETDQAKLAVFALKNSRWSKNVTHLMIYSYIDSVNAQPDREGYFGIIQSDGTRKEAWAAIQAEIQEG